MYWATQDRILKCYLCLRSMLRPHQTCETIHIPPGQVLFFLEPTWTILVWKELGTLQLWNQGQLSQNTKILSSACRWRHSTAAFPALQIFLPKLLLSNNIQLLFPIEACSTNKAVKRNNLSEKCTPKNSNKLPCQRGLAIYPPRLDKDVASPSSAASFLCDLTLVSYSFPWNKKPCQAFPHQLKMAGSSVVGVFVCLFVFH